MPFEYVTFQLNATKELVRNDSMEDKDWLVVPTQMITEGVHSGSGGKIYYPPDELAKAVNIADHKPVVVYHPQVNGTYVSACDRDQLDVRKVGMLLNTAYNGETTKLSADAYLEPSRLDKVDNRIAAAIDNNQMMEVSTGFFMTLEKKKGVWNDEEYDFIAHDLQLDHLAILPDQKGACSIADGAGLLRANNELRQLMVNEMSHDSIRRLLSTLIAATRGNAWIEEVYDTFVIIEDGGALYKLSYTNTDGQVKLAGDATQVIRVTEYRTLTGDFVGNKDKFTIYKGKEFAMNKQEMVNNLISSEQTNWTEDDRKSLMGLNEKMLANMVALLKEPEESDTAEPVDNADPAPAPAPQPATPVANTAQPASVPKKKPVTLNDYIANTDLPTEVREALEESIATNTAEKQRLINIITANERNPFTEDFLKTKKVTELRGLAALAQTAAPSTPDNVPMFIGMGEPAGDAGQLPDPLPLPVMNFGDKD